MEPTPLEKLRKAGTVLKSPLEKLGNIEFTSWVNDVLPDVLWSTLIATALPRDKTISTFRIILTRLKENSEAFGKHMLTHSHLAHVDDGLFDAIFGFMFQDKETKSALAPLAMVETLPDIRHWKRYLDDDPLEGADFKLALAVAECFNHQSQASTDCRWVRVMTYFALDRMVVAEEMAEKVDLILKYPDKGDMRSVRPSIRAMEIMTRRPSEGEPAPYNEAFWDEFWRRSDCIMAENDGGAALIDRSALHDAIEKIDNEIGVHFGSTLSTTKIDPRHDAAFGLVLYVSHLLTVCLQNPNGQTVIGRLALRSAVEVYITLSYLAIKDDDTIWLQFRNYGNGQHKLSYLKSLKDPGEPSFMTKASLEALANEDMWHEYMDIKLGAWDGKDLRKMATESKVKDFYDRYYDALSSYVHGNWMAVRHSVFGQCLNPLHRLHRIPLKPRAFAEDSLPDLVKILNLCLDRLSSLYPPFKHRLHIKDFAVKAKETPSPPIGN